MNSIYSEAILIHTYRAHDLFFVWRAYFEVPGKYAGSLAIGMWLYWRLRPVMTSLMNILNVQTAAWMAY